MWQNDYHHYIAYGYLLVGFVLSCLDAERCYGFIPLIINALSWPIWGFVHLLDVCDQIKKRRAKPQKTKLRLIS